MKYLFCQACGRWLGARRDKCPDCGTVSQFNWKNTILFDLLIQFAIGALGLFSFWLFGLK
ncbi:hypothetical protein [Bradyrhizobium sp. UFLA03-84]|uniref:hypothetical protein n=1 Tax=Bradyrhizobium sp. UFLA03-84 TaxID=418599 RepID=UPI000BAE082A|nr:hypothetical protein [Bradyrhizobium sp. UFLA03-84]